jgi:flap endonuclease-1
VGLFNRAISMTEQGIRPVWVFDGLPPNLKRKELTRRKKLKQEAKEKLAEAKESGTVEQQLKQHQRQVKMSSQTIEDAMKMLSLMGFPVIKASAEAESQCVELLRKGLVDAVGSEDMDCLTFGCSMLLRGLKSKDRKIVEIQLSKVLEELELTMDEFVDFCILCGCDYCDSIKNMGPVKALKYIKKYKTIEKVLEALKKENEEGKSKLKFGIPSGDAFLFEQARELFKTPDVLKEIPKVSWLIRLHLGSQMRRS